MRDKEPMSNIATSLDDLGRRWLTPELRQQLPEGLGDPLVRQLLDLVLIPGEDLTGRVVRRVRSMLPFEQNQRGLSKCRCGVRDTRVGCEHEVRSPNQREGVAQTWRFRRER